MLQLTAKLAAQGRLNHFGGDFRGLWSTTVLCLEAEAMLANGSSLGGSIVGVADWDAAPPPPPRREYRVT